MAIRNEQITVDGLSGSQTVGTDLYTSSGNNAITTIIVCNNGSTPIDLSLYAVPNGKNPYNYPETIIVSNLTIPGHETVSFDQEKMVFANGDSLQAVASVAYSGTGLQATVSTLAV